MHLFLRIYIFRKHLGYFCIFLFLHSPLYSAHLCSPFSAFRIFPFAKRYIFLTYLSKYSTYVNRLINDNLKAIVNLSKCIQLLTLWKVPSSVSIWNKDICLYSGTLKSILITRWLTMFQKLNVPSLVKLF